MDSKPDKMFCSFTSSENSIFCPLFQETLSDRPIEVAPTSVIYAPMYASEEQQKLKYPVSEIFFNRSYFVFGYVTTVLHGSGEELWLYKKELGNLW